MLSSAPNVRDATAGELAKLSETLADAFANDPILQWLIPSRLRGSVRRRRLFEVELKHYAFPIGRVSTTDDCRGASLELAPDNWKMPAMPVSAAVGLLRAFGVRLASAGRTQAFFERHHLEEPHYYVRYVGVAQRFQGQGMGTALLRPTLERCDREGLPAYLEASSARSAALYERLGFAHLGELRCPDGPPYWPMRRPPGGD